MLLLVSLSKNGGICRSASASQTSHFYNARKYSEEKEKSKVVLDRGPFCSHIDYLSRLQYNSTPFTFPLSGIICTIGPASNKPECLVKLMEAGMKVARCNFSHGSHEYHCQTIENIRRATNLYCRSKGVYKDVAIALDTKGPEIRTGKISGDVNAKIELKQGDNIKLSTKKEFETKCTKDVLYVDYSNITKIVKPGVHAFIDDGLISLLVQKVSDSEITCVIENGGKLGSQKSINLPGLPVDLPNVTERDKSDLLFGVQQKVDMVFASFIREAQAVEEIRKILGSQGRHIKIIPKIECQQALKNIDEIIKASDGIMVARGDLGIEILPEEVTIAQKSIIAKCNKLGKPVICATQMLDSMTSAPRPTRAEASDVANAIFDGADCVMLSGETASGKYPVQCVKCMANICAKVEPCLWYDRLQNEVKSIAKATSTNHLSAVSSAVAEAAIASNARIIVIASPCAIVPSMISQFRPNCPIIFLTGSPVQARQSLLYRALYPLVLAEMKSRNSDFSTVLQSGFKLVCKNKMLPPGQIVTVVVVDALKADRISFGLLSVRQCIPDNSKNGESKPKGGMNKCVKIMNKNKSTSDLGQATKDSSIKSSCEAQKKNDEVKLRQEKCKEIETKLEAKEQEKEIKSISNQESCGANQTTVQEKNPCAEFGTKNGHDQKSELTKAHYLKKSTKAKKGQEQKSTDAKKDKSKSTSAQKPQDNEIEDKPTESQNVEKSADAKKDLRQATKDNSIKSSCEPQKKNEVKMRQEIGKEKEKKLEAKEQEEEVKNKSNQDSCGANKMTVQEKNPCAESGTKNGHDQESELTKAQHLKKSAKVKKGQVQKSADAKKDKNKSTSARKPLDNEIEDKATEAQNGEKSPDAKKDQRQATKDESIKSSGEAQKKNDEVKMRQVKCKEIEKKLEAKEQEEEIKSKKRMNGHDQESELTKAQHLKKSTNAKKGQEQKSADAKKDKNKSTSARKPQDNEIEDKATEAQNIEKSPDAKKDQRQATKDKSIKSSCEAQKKNDEVKMRQEICKEIVKILEAKEQEEEIKCKSNQESYGANKMTVQETNPCAESDTKNCQDQESESTKAQHLKKSTKAKKGQVQKSAVAKKDLGQATKDKSIKSSCEAQKKNDEVKMRQEICKEIVKILEAKEQEEEIKSKSNQESYGANKMTVQETNPSAEPGTKNCQDQEIKSESTKAQYLKKSSKAEKGQEQATENKSTKQSYDAKKKRNQEKKRKDAVKKMCDEVTKRLEAKIIEKCRKAAKGQNEKSNAKNDGC